MLKSGAGVNVDVEPPPQPDNWIATYDKTTVAARYIRARISIVLDSYETCHLRSNQLQLHFLNLRVRFRFVLRTQLFHCQEHVRCMDQRSRFSSNRDGEILGWRSC